MMKLMMPDEKVRIFIDTVEIFVNGAIELQSVFSGNYDGGDFCSGLVFGMAGTKLLLASAHKMVKDSLPDDHNPAFKQQNRQNRQENQKRTAREEYLRRDREKHM